jgi:DNA-binding Lrp family transcriptional regulator
LELLDLSKKDETKTRLLLELIKSARRSDRDLAKVMKISQPTVTRKRTALEREGLVQEYTIIPNLEKMGYQILAFTFLSFEMPPKPALLEKAREWTNEEPSVIFAADGTGLSMNSVMVSAHKEYASYSRLLTRLREDWQPNLKDAQSFIICVNRPELLIKRFSFRYLGIKEQPAR